MSAQQSTITMYFNRGAFVMWVDSSNPAAPARHGIVECENSARPGWYYIRNEHGDLELIQWQRLALTSRP